MIEATDAFLGVNRISKAGFAAVLADYPANATCLAERDAADYWDACIAYGVDACFALAMFQHESQMGKAGTAMTTLSWGNTRSPSFGAIPYDEVDGRSGTFPAFNSWLDGCRSTVGRLSSLVWPTVAPYGERGSIAEVFSHPSGAVWAPAGDLNNPAGYLASMLRLMNAYADQDDEPIAATQAPMPPVYCSYLTTNYTEGRGNTAVKAIVLHITSGPSAASAISWFRNPASGVSSHYVIDRDGTIYATVHEDDTAWVNGVVEHPNQTIPIVSRWVTTDTNPNLETIGIEMAGYSRLQPGGHPPELVGYTEPQFAALAYLLPVLSVSWGVRLHPDWLFGHNEISGTQRRACPGLTSAEWSRIYATALPVPSEGPYSTPDAAYDAWCAQWDDEVAWAGEITGKQHWYGREPQELARTIGNRLLAYDGAYAQDASGWALDEWSKASEANGQLIIWRAA